MSIPIEGLVELGTNQEKNSTPSKRYRLINGTILNSFSQGGRLKRWSSGLSSVGLFLATACGSPVRAGESPSVPEATATAFTEVNPDVVPQVNIPGVGKVGISIPEAATAGNPPQESATLVANPEVKKGFDNGILSPEAYTKAEYIQWDIPGGRGKAEGIGLILGADEEFKIPEDMQVAAIQRMVNGKPSGYRIIAVRADGSQITLSGDVIPNADKEIGPVGKNLPKGTVIGTSGGSGLTNFPGYDFTQLLTFSKQEDLRGLFPHQTPTAPRFITNTITAQADATPRQGATFFDVKPPAG